MEYQPAGAVSSIRVRQVTVILNSCLEMETRRENTRKFAESSRVATIVAVKRKRSGFSLIDGFEFRRAKSLIGLLCIYTPSKAVADICDAWNLPAE
jgi:hypothetical protein